MKKVMLLSALFFSAVLLQAQSDVVPASGKMPLENRNFRIPLLGEDAPSFTAESTNGIVNFPDDFGKKWKILFSHPQDFTPVCSSELLELANLQDDFDKLGVKLIVISSDALSTHEQWKKSLESLYYKGRTTEKIKFPLVADENLGVSKQYGMIHSAHNSTKDVRGVFVIDPENKVRAIYFYPNNVGRNTGELLRTVTALQTTDKLGVATPADWKFGDDVIVTHPPITDQENLTVPEGYNKISWFIWTKRSDVK
jgi:peroxiredoxin 2/4